jgi:hypothetical protein
MNVCTSIYAAYRCTSGLKDAACAGIYWCASLIAGEGLAIDLLLLLRMFHEGELPHHKVLLLQHCCFNILASTWMNLHHSLMNTKLKPQNYLVHSLNGGMQSKHPTAKQPVQNAGQHAFATLLQGGVDYLQRD